MRDWEAGQPVEFVTVVDRLPARWVAAGAKRHQQVEPNHLPQVAHRDPKDANDEGMARQWKWK
jgi:hypothetical protein